MSEYNPASWTGGAKPMAIAGRMVRERERLQGMSDMERAWRAQWLKDQILAPDEPIVPANWYKQRYNPLRRFYRAPMDLVENALRPRLGQTGAYYVRHLCAKAFMTMCGVYFMWYHIKYNGGDWTKKSSWRVSQNRAAMFPNDPGFPNYYVPEPDEYASFGFKNSPI